jgi:hypothetical protein
MNSPPPKGRIFALLKSGNQKANTIMPLNMAQLMKAQQEILLKNVDEETRLLYLQKPSIFAGVNGMRYLNSPSRFGYRRSRF